MKYYNTLTPYKQVEYGGIQYNVCRDFNHISRYRCIRQLTHNPDDNQSRFVTLETTNPFTTHCEVTYYDVPATEENRLDIIAYKYLGSSSYAWVIAYFNQIEDGYTVREGQRLAIPKSVASLMNSGEMLAPINALSLNLGSE